MSFVSTSDFPVGHLVKVTGERRRFAVLASGAHFVVCCKPCYRSGGLFMALDIRRQLEVRGFRMGQVTSAADLLQKFESDSIAGLLGTSRSMCVESVDPPTPKCQHGVRRKSDHGSRWVRIDGDIAYIELANSRGYAIIDATDVPLVSAYKWVGCNYVGKAFKYAKATVDGKHTMLHRLIHGNPPEGLCVDHRNRNGLDCRRQNLRAATPEQNAANVGHRVDKFRGVSRHGRGWRAWVKHKHLGIFDTPEEAASVADRERLRLYGDFAVLNFPPDGASL